MLLLNLPLHSSDASFIDISTKPCMSRLSPSDATAPLLRPRPGETVSGRPPTLAMLLGRASGRRAPSMLVRETAARQLEERRVDWGYSKPVVALDILWNLSFVIVSAAMLILTADERPNVPIRVWICGYAVQCLVHVILVWLEYERRNTARSQDDQTIRPGGGYHSDSNDTEDEDGRVGVLGITNRSSASRRCESLNTVASFVWWLIGFYWVISSGQTLLQSSPYLYWLAVVFLAFDVFFAIFCVVLACLIGIALCCCLPCIIAILYAVAGQEGASDADLSVLPKYRYEICSDGQKPQNVAGNMVPIASTSGFLATGRALLHEDAECCICLSMYEDGCELHTLPCNHHFHVPCIVKWLKMNATCPLCKFNILKGAEQV